MRVEYVRIPLGTNHRRLHDGSPVGFDERASLLDIPSELFDQNGNLTRLGFVTFGRNFDEPIDVTVIFSKPVITKGKLRVRMDLAGDTYAIRDGINVQYSRDASFYFEYEQDHRTADLDYLSSTALEIVDGTIRDEFGNDAILTLPKPGAPGSLSANRNIVIGYREPNPDTVFADTFRTTGADGSVGGCFATRLPSRTWPSATLLLTLGLLFAAGPRKRP